MANKWNLAAIEQFYQSKQCDPYEFNSLCTADPCGRMLAALKSSEKAFAAAKNEYRALGTGDFSILPARSEELGGIMQAALATRTGHDCRV